MNLFYLFGLLFVGSVYGNVVQMDTNDFQARLQSIPKALVTFSTAWCGLCKVMAPEFEAGARLALEQAPNVVFVTVDCTLDTATALNVGVGAFPTIRFYKNGIVDSVPVRFRNNGGRTASAFLEFVKTKN